MRPHPLLATSVILVMFLLSSASPGSAGDAPGSAVGSIEQAWCEQGAVECPGPVSFDAICDMHTKTCVGDSGADLPAYPMAGWILEPLRPFLDPGTYGILWDLLDGDDKEDPGEIIPPLPPTGLPVDVELGEEHDLGFHGGEFSIHAAFNASAVGVSLSASSNFSASATLEGGDPPPAEPGQVPCSDPRGCPDLTVDPTKLLEGGIFTRSFDAEDCSVQEGSTEPGQRRLMRFTFASPNFGNGDLIIGDPDDHPEWFEWGDCHGHWHFREYADYRLWTPEGYVAWKQVRADDPDASPEEVLDSNPELRDGFVAGHKQGFCAIDIQFYVPFSTTPTYRNCETNQGISSGWADVYHFGLDGQWIDVTDVEPGLYVLEAEVNSERLFQESDYTNNDGAVFVAIPQE